MEQYIIFVGNGDLESLKLLFPNLNQYQQQNALDLSIRYSHKQLVEWIIQEGISLSNYSSMDGLWDYICHTIYNDCDYILPHICLEPWMICSLLTYFCALRYIKLLYFDCSSWTIEYGYRVKI